MPLLLPAPVRINSTVSRQLQRRLSNRAHAEGRSLSNLVAFILETAMNDYDNYPQ